MLHRRSPTRTGYPSIHAALALRHPHPSIPTLLSPLRSIANSPPLGPTDDFQSNACLAGLGISYLRDPCTNDQPFPPDHSALRMHVDPLLALYDDTRRTDMLPGPCVPWTSLGLSLSSEPTSPMDLGFDEIDLPASEIVGLIPDVNMYDKLRELDPPHPGVNPLDTIRSTPLHDTAISCDEHISMTLEDLHVDDIPCATNAEQSPSPRVIQDIMSILVQPAPESSLLPCPSANSPSTQSPSPSRSATSRSRSSMSVKLEPTNTHDGEYHPDYSNTIHSSPVLNAHLGIELSELISKAERFRTKYPERDIDRAWLSHFAGKLSNRGELLNDFRCYVVGCDQRNKRRDHILVHVGAHIGQRPFACSVCSMRFLRKNECKRHEASHSGSRPYSCDICGQSFVRQDLVKRHVKRTHGAMDENQFGAAKQPRKKTKPR